MITNSKKEDIVGKLIKTIHNKDIISGVRKYNKEKGLDERSSFNYKYHNNESNINLDWDHEELNIINLFVVSLILIINIYLIFSLNLILLFGSNIVSCTILYILYLDGSITNIIESLFRDRLDSSYKEYLETILYKYIDVIIKKMESCNGKLSREELLNLNMLEYLDKDDVIISNGLIVNRIVTEILNLNPKIVSFRATKENADIIINKSKKDEIPSFDIKKNNVVIDYSVDNSTYCIGCVEENSIIVYIEELKDGTINIKDSKGLSIFIGD